MFIPIRISQRLTMGSILLLLLTGLAVFGVMSLRGQPRVVAVSQQLIEQTGSSIVRQLALKLASVEGITLSLARIAEVLPREQALYLNSLPNVIDNNGDLTIAGGGIWPEPDQFEVGSHRHSFFWARGLDNKLTYSDEYNAESGPGYQNESWYTGARASSRSKCSWSEAYQDPVSRVAMVTCSVPYHLLARFAGVATVDLKLDNVAQFLTEHGNVTDGYAFALDQAGNILHFPEASKSETMQRFSDVVSQQPWLAPVEAAIKQTSINNVISVSLAHDEKLDQASEVSLFVMPDTGWVIGLATPKTRVTGLANALTFDILLFLLPLLAILLSLAWFSGKRLLAQLQETTDQIASLGSGESGSHVELQIQRDDEIGALRRAVNTYAGTLRSMLDLITQEAKKIQYEASQLSALSRKLAQRAEQQRLESAQLAAAITQMSSSAIEVANNTNDCAATAQSSLVVVREGQCRVAESNASIEILSSEIANATQVISQLAQDSQKVGTVLDVIKAISAQTNLLALNAAIEAARAGEQGRGFAVVADEVRTLAGRTQDSADEISTMINALQSASRLAVQAMQTGESRTVQAVAEAEGAASSLSSTVQSFDDISQRAQQIALAAQQQSLVTQEINELAVRINSISEDNSHDATALDALSLEMQNLSNRLININRT
ncbi:methyl-accepting chemotaxis protein [Shewanella glacialipiscicola]|uniref:methyl-accepting chemotaxis protein n=1 Tax=Shewanella glacialipiscicola TaxID=614069 RepID=UPI0021D91099|nr:methyl-accepting chemotaxis protein [Shewanella glacialipiscicola]MCU7993618.1 methyl-accepting chemotaxis protein [Shewanella glacialipiscicola]MCU8024936.1 methyl-accepting chemotaxis protein [Shewanella glacialipiscicola]